MDFKHSRHKLTQDWRCGRKATLPISKCPLACSPLRFYFYYACSSLFSLSFQISASPEVFPSLSTSVSSECRTEPTRSDGTQREGAHLQPMKREGGVHSHDPSLLVVHSLRSWAPLYNPTPRFALSQCMHPIISARGMSSALRQRGMIPSLCVCTPTPVSLCVHSRGLSVWPHQTVAPSICLCTFYF